MSKLQELIQKLCPDRVEYSSLGKYIDIYTGIQFNKKDMSEVGTYPVLNGGINPSGFTENFNEQENTITISQGGASAGYVNWMKCKFWAGAHCFIVKPNINILNKRYLYFLLKNSEQRLMQSKHGAGIPGLNRDNIRNLIIPIPPLAVQEEIVRILDTFTSHVAELQAELQARKEQYEYYRNKLLTFEKDAVGVEWKRLPDICENLDRRRKPVSASNRNFGPYPYYGASGIVDYVSSYIFDGNYLLISEDGANLLARSTPIAFSISGKNWVNNHAHVLKFQNMFTQKYIEHYINMIDVSQYVSGGAQPKLNQENLNKILIPIPPLHEQQRIVSILDKFETLVNDLSQGLPAEIAAVQEQYEYYRNKLLSFPKNKVNA